MAQPALRRGRTWRRRRGLAPVEFVLWAPVLLMVMALMVNYGAAAAWRLRGEIVSRDAIWRTRWPRPAGDEAAPAPPVWPIGATQTVNGGPALASVDLPPLQQPVARGPLPGGFVVRPILDPTRGAEAGQATVSRRYPLLPRLGSFDSGRIVNPLLDRPWTCADMGIPNSYRRTLVLYQLPKADPSLSAAYAAAAQDMLGIPHFSALSAFVRDADWLRYQPWHGQAVRDFHPRINPSVCDLDRMRVYRNEVQRLVDVRQGPGRWRLGEISRLPRTLTSAFLGMYQATKAGMEAELNAMPPPPPARVNFLQNELQYVDQQIDLLQQFQGRIAGFENGLRTRP